VDRPSFQSILFNKPVSETEVDAQDIPAFFRDLNLDQILQSITKGREEYGLGPFFCYPLNDVEAIGYRQDVMRDLEVGGLRNHIDSFAESMRAIRQHLSQADKLHYQYQKIGWFLDAAEIYCDAIRSLYDGLSRANPNSQGFRSLRDYLGTYVSSEGFKSLLGETKKLKEKLSGIEYRIHIQGLRVTVGKYGGEPDYSAEVEETLRGLSGAAAEIQSVKDRLGELMRPRGGVEGVIQPSSRGGAREG
jgi:DNA mismatch repair protein MutS